MKESIRTRAAQLGFEDCRFTSAAPPATGPALIEWLAAGHHGEMAWIARNAQKRLDPARVLHDARSIIVLAASYALASPRGYSPGPVALYARHADYHEILGQRLATLADYVSEIGGPGAKSLWYVDTGPLLERDLGQRAGIGFVGKHTNLISHSLGNWFFIAEIITSVPLDPDTPGANRCGSCARCIHACPTRAITAPFKLDARRCISYLTIEWKGPIPQDLRPSIGNRIFGCDECLAVCPWNRFARQGALLKEHFRPNLSAPDLHEFLEMDDARFKQRFHGTPIHRLKRPRFLRNVCVALGNTGGQSSLPLLEKAASDPEPLIAEHARWALHRLQRNATSRQPPCSPRD